jgi:molybdopterin-guanine dinucleotide biosynthesis protein A
VQNNIAAVILIGGRSSRMGRDKATLPFKNFRLVDHVANTIKEAGIADIFVSGELDGYDSIADIHKNKGPVAGICSSIMECYSKSFSATIITPVDMPFFSKELVETLINKENDIEAQYFEKHPLPLFIKINEDILKYCRQINKELKSNKDISVKAFLKALNTKQLKIPDYMMKNLKNTNTPQEWAEVVA